MGTSKFLLQMSLFIAGWLAWNSLAPTDWRFDPYTFTFLTLLLSLQASYAAPLILLAQNRQDDRDRTEARIDRERAAMGVEINSFLARELSEMQRKLNDLSMDINMSNRNALSRKKFSARDKELNDRLDRIEQAVLALTAKVDPPPAKPQAKAKKAPAPEPAPAD
ncbi:DUF1003 domain-containing protein [Nakamurella sp. YIM 132087]|uniref:DUF1003 domain-containing protein n=2 Tax=Nakamurella alba TaxID=2665158 RepID=A0A7K1FQV0_9ACTN|nr:DUF1003 domain-containing protein [Nakamurella alba]